LRRSVAERATAAPAKTHRRRETAAAWQARSRSPAPVARATSANPPVANPIATTISIHRSGAVIPIAPNAAGSRRRPTIAASTKNISVPSSDCPIMGAARRKSLARVPSSAKRPFVRHTFWQQPEPDTPERSHIAIN